MTAGESRLSKACKVLLKLLITLAYLSPFYVALVYSVKSKSEIAAHRLAFPKTVHWENFSNGVVQSGFWNALKNSIVTTVIVVVALTVFCSMAAYIIARKKSPLYTASYYLLLGTMLIPFQAVMMPLYSNLKSANLINTLTGFSISKIGFEVAFTTLLITGFVKGIPLELEEAASIDGSGRYGTFWRIVFPLMKPIIATTAVLNALGTWNDFQVSVVILQKNTMHTLSLTQYYFFGKNSIELGMAFAVFVLSMIPILALYLTMQRYIISGITSGAVKG